LVIRIFSFILEMRPKGQMIYILNPWFIHIPNL
jgi:hypothetical protein